MTLSSARVIQRGDLMIVKLMDTTYKVYFKGKANINNPKEIRQLQDDLRQKGVSL